MINEPDNLLNALVDDERNWRRFVMLSAGLSKIWQRGGSHISSYHELIDDDWDGNKSGLEQLRSSERILQTVLECSRNFSTMFDSMISRELMGIAPVIDGVLGALRREYEQEILQDRNLSALVMADAFFLQDALKDSAEAVLSLAGSELNVSCDVVNLSGSDIALIQGELSPGAYVMISLLHGDADPLKLSSFRTACDVELLNSSEIEQSRLLCWVGCALLHGGECLIHRSGAARGVAFLLPLAEQGRNGDVRAQQVNGRPETILVVDDEDMIWDVVINMLGDLGYTVLLAANGKDAVDIYQANPHEIDLVLMDMLMPVMNGRDAFHLLVAGDPKVNVLLASGYVDEADVQDVLKAGARGFMRKPFKLSDLASKVREILDKANG